MLPHAFALLAAVSLPHTSTFEITSDKPFVQASIDGSAPQWFILDNGAARGATTSLGPDA